MGEARSQPANLSWEIKRDNGTCMLALVGELDLASAGALDAAVSEAAQGVAVLVCDLNELTFIDSTGLRFLIRWRDTLRDSGAALLLANTPEPAAKVLHVSGLVDFFDYAEGPPPQP